MRTLGSSKPNTHVEDFPDIPSTTPRLKKGRKSRPFFKTWSREKISGSRGYAPSVCWSTEQHRHVDIRQSATLHRHVIETADRPSVRLDGSALPTYRTGRIIISHNYVICLWPPRPLWGGWL